MDVLEFVRELKRMCNLNRGCSNCPALGCPCHISNLEEILPIVEKWSAEHPKVTNLDHYAEKLEEIGFKVDKKELFKYCPVHKSHIFTEYSACEAKAIEQSCKKCHEWWNEEYEGNDINVLSKGEEE